MIAKTGQKCPQSGIWQVVGFPTTTAPIAKGNKMPPYKNKGVIWMLIQVAQVIQGPFHWNNATDPFMLLFFYMESVDLYSKAVDTTKAIS